MPSATDRIEFAPPPPPGLIRAFALALAAHLILLLALTWGVNWRHQSQELSAEAELWASVPQQAAARPVQPVPPTPAPVPTPSPPPVPAKPAEPAPAPAPREADITLEQQKKRQADAEREQARRAQAQREQAQREQAQREQQRKDAEKKAADAKRLQEAERARQAAEDARLKALREENLRRMAGLAGATGSATGNAQRSAGPSDSYAGRIRARIKPNIVFTDDVAGNPTAEVEVRAAPDGTVVGRKVVKSSGVRSWDDAVLKAIDKAAVLPRDVDGRVHSPLTLVFRLRD